MYNCVIGDLRWPKYHPNTTQMLPGYTYPPPKILCAAFQMQYHKPNGLWTPEEWNNTRQIILNGGLNDNTLCCIKAVSQLNVYHSLQQNVNNDDNEKNNDNNENNGI